MTNPEDTIRALSQNISDLKQRLDEANEALDANRSSSVDAFVISGEKGEAVYTLQGAEYNYRVLIESINEGALTLSEDGTILYSNWRFADMLLTPLEAVIGSPIQAYISAESQAAFQDLFSQGLRQSCRGEIKLVCRDGSHLPVMVSLNAFNPGSVKEICMVVSDLTEQKKAEDLAVQIVRRAETLSIVSRSLVEAGPDEQAILSIISRSAEALIGGACLIVLISYDGQWIKRAACYHPDSAIMQSLLDLPAQVPHHTGMGLTENVIRTGEGVFMPVVDQSQMGKLFKFELLDWIKKFEVSSLVIVPVWVNDKALGAMALLRTTHGLPYTAENLEIAQNLADQMALAISNTRLYRDLQSALEKEQTMRLQLIQAEKHTALSRMMASVAHEINNPVQTIKNCLFLTTMALPADSPLSEYLSMASTETDRIVRLVTNLRDIYHPAKNEPKQPLNLSKVVAEVHALLEPHLANQKVAWQQLESEDEFWVEASLDQLKQVFLNISLNAIDAMQPGGGKIFVSMAASQERDQVALVFKDTGPGIPAEALLRVFEPFFTTKDIGTGLGLAICYEIIQRHGGSISVQSQPGQGAAFTILLPLILKPIDLAGEPAD